MAARFSLDFGKKHFFRREVKVFRWERFHYSCDESWSECDHKVGIQRKTGSPIGNRGESADDAVRNFGRFEFVEDELKLLHSRSRRFCEFWTPRPLQTNRGVGI